MVNFKNIRENLKSQRLPVCDTDLPFIQNILFTIEQAEISLEAFPYLNMEVPITVVDKDLMT